MKPPAHCWRLLFDPRTGQRLWQHQHTKDVAITVGEVFETDPRTHPTFKLLRTDRPMKRWKRSYFDMYSVHVKPRGRLGISAPTAKFCTETLGMKTT